MLMEQLDRYLLFRLFAGLSMEVWDNSTFSKNRERLFNADIESIRDQAQNQSLLSDQMSPSKGRSSKHRRHRSASRRNETYVSTNGSRCPTNGEKGLSSAARDGRHSPLPRAENLRGEAEPRGPAARSRGARSLVFSGLMDTPAHGTRSVFSDPFSGSVRDGRLYGRGSIDMKVGTAAGHPSREAFGRLGLPWEERGCPSPWTQELSARRPARSWRSSGRWGRTCMG